MLPEPRAVVLDMDDTLYPYRRFRVSGFRAVAEFLAREHGVDRARALRLMLRASRDHRRGRELQACLDAVGLPERLVASLLQVFDEHDPAIRLPKTTRLTLQRLRLGGWRVGVLTNGPVERQRRRVRALDLEALTDRVVYAESHGGGTGKPDPGAFEAVAAELRTPAPHVVFVGDDEVCDVMGSTLAGMHAVRADTWRVTSGPTAARATLERMADLPDLAASLLDDGVTHYAVA